jgi:hypothetical protein
VTSPFDRLAAQWREQASSPFVVPDVQRTILACAADLEDAIRDHDNELLTPKQAAAECFLAEGTVRNWLANDKLPNEGGPYKPLVRRKALHVAVNKRRAIPLDNTVPLVYTRV